MFYISLCPHPPSSFSGTQEGEERIGSREYPEIPNQYALRPFPSLSYFLFICTERESEEAKAAGCWLQAADQADGRGLGAVRCGLAGLQAGAARNAGWCNGLRCSVVQCGVVLAAGSKLRGLLLVPFFFKV